MEPVRAREKTPEKTLPAVEQAAPDYDHLPRGDFNPMWEVAVAILLLLSALATIVAFS